MPENIDQLVINALSDDKLIEYYSLLIEGEHSGSSSEAELWAERRLILARGIYQRGLIKRFRENRD